MAEARMARACRVRVSVGRGVDSGARRIGRLRALHASRTPRAVANCVCRGCSPRRSAALRSGRGAAVSPVPLAACGGVHARVHTRHHPTRDRVRVRVKRSSWRLVTPSGPRGPCRRKNVSCVSDYGHSEDIAGSCRAVGSAKPVGGTESNDLAVHARIRYYTTEYTTSYWVQVRCATPQ